MSEILLYSTDSAPLKDALDGVDVLSQMGHVFVVKDTQQARDRARRLAPTVKMLFHSQAASAAIGLLSKSEQMFVRAWLNKQPVDQLQGAGLAWDTPGYKAP